MWAERQGRQAGTCVELISETRNLRFIENQPQQNFIVNDVNGEKMDEKWHAFVHIYELA